MRVLRGVSKCVNNGFFELTTLGCHALTYNNSGRGKPYSIELCQKASHEQALGKLDGGNSSLHLYNGTIKVYIHLCMSILITEHVYDHVLHVNMYSQF